jgi:hypothetical protein
MRKRACIQIFSLTVLMLLLTQANAQTESPSVFSDVALSTGTSLVNWAAPNSGDPAPTKGDQPVVKAPNPCNPDAEQRQLKADRQKSAEDNQPKVNLSCLKKFSQFNVGANIGIPSRDALIQQALNQVCNAADSQISPVVGAANQGLPLPGGVGRVNTGAVFGSSPNVSGAGATIGSGGITQSGSNPINQGGSGYSLPPLWK